MAIIFLFMLKKMILDASRGGCVFQEWSVLNALASIAVSNVA